jgi:hypothetical protein
VTFYVTNSSPFGGRGSSHESKGRCREIRVWPRRKAVPNMPPPGGHAGIGDVPEEEKVRSLLSHFEAT